MWPGGPVCVGAAGQVVFRVSEKDTTDLSQSIIVSAVDPETAGCL